jgi:hypothetical protein
MHRAMHHKANKLTEQDSGQLPGSISLESNPKALKRANSLISCSADLAQFW